MFIIRKMFHINSSSSKNHSHSINKLSVYPLWSANFSSWHYALLTSSIAIIIIMGYNFLLRLLILAILLILLLAALKAGWLNELSWAERNAAALDARPLTALKINGRKLNSCPICEAKQKVCSHCSCKINHKRHGQHKKKKMMKKMKKSYAVSLVTFGLARWVYVGWLHGLQRTWVALLLRHATIEPPHIRAH